MWQEIQKRISGLFVGRRRQVTICIFILIFLFGTAQAIYGKGGTITVQTDAQKLGVLGTSQGPSFVPFSDVTELQLLDGLEFGTCLEGDETANTLSGIYENDLLGTYVLHVYKEKSPYILVRYGQDEALVFNQKSEKSTQKVYEDLVSKIR